MSTISFTVKGGQYPAIRSENAPALITANFSLQSIRTPTAVRKDTMAMDGNSGTSRLRGFYYEGTIAIPQIKLAEIPLYIDFFESMKYGMDNPFFCDGTDNFGIDRSFTAYVTDFKTNFEIQTCTEWSVQFKYRELPNG